MDSLNNLEYDEAYNPSHKTTSITSIDSADHPPSLYTGRADSCSSLCDPDELREPLFFDDPNPYEILKMKQRSSISIPFEDLETYQSFIIPESNTFELNHHDNKEQQDVVDQQEKSSIVKETNSYSDELNYSTSCENNLTKTIQSQSPTTSNSISSSTLIKVLSQDEKRANHIASEQKRRQNIRNGFKQLSDIIPTLKNMPHSKSTILFKAADYIKHTEKRNKILQDRLKHLQRKLALSATISNQQYPNMINPSTSSTSSSTSPPSIYHSTQEKIRLLQQQLLHQHQLLLKHNIISNQQQQQQQYYHSPSTSSAIVMPVQHDDDDEIMPATNTTSFHSTPCLHIPADEDYYQESMNRERLLSCGKLNFN
ncbi:unnamed protein product [Cunninghamella echinulata]